jgi:hypothetical protein
MLEGIGQTCQIHPCKTNLSGHVQSAGIPELLLCTARLALMPGPRLALPCIPSSTIACSEKFLVSRRLSENTSLSFRTKRSEERNLEKSRCYCERDFSLSLEMTVLGQPPGLWFLGCTPFSLLRVLQGGTRNCSQKCPISIAKPHAWAYVVFTTPIPHP